MLNYQKSNLSMVILRCQAGLSKGNPNDSPLIRSVYVICLITKGIHGSENEKMIDTYIDTMGYLKIAFFKTQLKWWCSFEFWGTQLSDKDWQNYRDYHGQIWYVQVWLLKTQPNGVKLKTQKNVGLPIWLVLKSDIAHKFWGPWKGLEAHFPACWLCAAN
jgi:hypothetical protein